MTTQPTTVAEGLEQDAERAFGCPWTFALSAVAVGDPDDPDWGAITPSEAWGEACRNVRAQRAVFARQYNQEA